MYSCAKYNKRYSVILAECVKSYLVLQRHDRVVLGCVDVQNVEAILPTQVVGDVSEGRAGCFGHSVVDDDRVVVFYYRRNFPPTPVFAVTLLYFGHLVSGYGAF